MKMVPYDVNKIENCYIPGRNQKIIQDFIDSDSICVKIEDYPHKSAKNCQIAMIRSLKAMHIKTVKVIVRGKNVFLLKVDI